MKPHYFAGRPIPEIIPEFEAYVNEQLESKGITGHDQARYHSANPAFMSVAGLMRYWHKHGRHVI